MTLARLIRLRSAADVFASPPRSAIWSAMSSLHLLTHAERPSTPGKSSLPFATRERCGSFGRAILRRLVGRSASESGDLFKSFSCDGCNRVVGFGGIADWCFL